MKEKAEKEPKTKDTKDKEKKVRFRSTNVNLFSTDSAFQRFIKSQRPKKRRRAERPQSQCLGIQEKRHERNNIIIDQSR